MPFKVTFSLRGSTLQAGYVTSHRSTSITSFSYFLFIDKNCSRNPDAYHTHYCLSGLSAAQHHVFPSSARSKQVEDAWVASRWFSFTLPSFVIDRDFTQTHCLMNSENVPIYNFSHGPSKKVVRIFGVARQIDWYASATRSSGSSWEY